MEAAFLLTLIFLLVPWGRDGHTWLRDGIGGFSGLLFRGVFALDRACLESFSSYPGSLWKQFMSVSCEQMVMHYFWHGEGKGDLTLHMNRHLWSLSYQSEDAKVKGEQSLAGPLCLAVPFTQSWLYNFMALCCFWKFFNLTADTNTVGLMSIFILACQKDTACNLWNRNRDGMVDGPASWVRNVRTSLTLVK